MFLCNYFCRRGYVLPKDSHRIKFLLCFVLYIYVLHPNVYHPELQQLQTVCRKCTFKTMFFLAMKSFPMVKRFFKNLHKHESVAASTLVRPGRY